MISLLFQFLSSIGPDTKFAYATWFIVLMCIIIILIIILIIVCLIKRSRGGRYPGMEKYSLIDLSRLSLCALALLVLVALSGWLTPSLPLHSCFTYPRCTLLLTYFVSPFVPMLYLPLLRSPIGWRCLSLYALVPFPLVAFSDWLTLFFPFLPVFSPKERTRSRLRCWTRRRSWTRRLHANVSEID